MNHLIESNEKHHSGRAWMGWRCAVTASCVRPCVGEAQHTHSHTVCAQVGRGRPNIVRPWLVHFVPATELCSAHRDPCTNYPSAIDLQPKSSRLRLKKQGMRGSERIMTDLTVRSPYVPAWRSARRLRPRRNRVVAFVVLPSPDCSAQDCKFARIASDGAPSLPIAPQRDGCPWVCGASGWTKDAYPNDKSAV